MIRLSQKEKIIDECKKYLIKKGSATARQMSMHFISCNSVKFPTQPTASQIAMILRAHKDFTFDRHRGVCLWKIKE